MEARILLALFALSTMALPLWGLSFNAPSSGEGWKTIIVYGTGSVQGPIDLVNKANQYVGLEVLEPNDILALKLIPLTYILAALLTVSGGWKVSFKKSAALYLTLLATVPVGIQYWLYTFGHNLNPDAPIALDPFTPYVFGSYEVATYKIVSYLHAGFFALAAVLAVSYLLERKWDSNRSLLAKNGI